jgi:hypothetical protein
MAPKKQDLTIEPRAEISFGPFSELRTIPGGWDVSAFLNAELDDFSLPADFNVEEFNENSKKPL